MSSWLVRFRRAIACVAICLAALAGASFAQNYEAFAQSNGLLGIVESALSGEEGVRAVEAYELNASNIDSSFFEEIADLSDVESMYVASDGHLVGWEQEGAADEVFAQLCETLEAKGWILTSSTERTCATFLKSGGRYSWAMASCFDMDGTTSIVMQVEETGVG